MLSPRKARDWVLRIRKSSLRPQPLNCITSDKRQTNTDPMGRGQGWELGLARSKPFFLSFDRTSEKFFSLSGS